MLALREPAPHRSAALRQILAPDCGSQLWDYLCSRVCLRPLGYDPMINVLSVDDAAAAIVAALRSDSIGVFNIRGADTLPLSRAIAESHRFELPVPGPLSPLYALRRRIAGFSSAMTSTCDGSTSAGCSTAHALPHCSVTNQ